MSRAAPPGAQPERTRLAWRRTTLTFAMANALAMRSALQDPGPVAYGAAALGVLAWLGFLMVAHHRIRALTDRAPAAASGLSILAAVLCVLTSAFLGMGFLR